MSVRFQGGPQDGETAEVGPPGEYTGIWDPEHSCYLIHDEDGDAVGQIHMTQQVFEMRPMPDLEDMVAKPTLRQLMKTRMFWALAVFLLSILIQVPMVLVLDFKVRSLGYMISWNLMIVAFVLKPMRRR